MTWLFPNSSNRLSYRKQRGRCMYCGRKVALVDTDIEHKIPRSRGGTDRESNLQITCGRCNRRKGDMTDGEFRSAFRSVGLLPAKQAKGKPSSPAIPMKKFDAASKNISDRKAKSAKKRRRKDDELFWAF